MVQIIHYILDVCIINQFKILEHVNIKPTLRVYPGVLSVLDFVAAVVATLTFAWLAFTVVVVAAAPSSPSSYYPAVQIEQLVALLVALVYFFQILLLLISTPFLPF